MYIVPNIVPNDKKNFKNKIQMIFSVFIYQYFFNLRFTQGTKTLFSKFYHYHF